MVGLIADCKVGEDPAAGRALAALLPEHSEAVDAVVPVPPSPGRRGGPHLATLLARTAARRGGRPLRRLLAIRALAAEQHLLAAGDRQRNVRHLFRCRGASPARVLLVDDILTSGATAQAASAALRAAGARRVHLLCLARTPRSDDDAPATEAGPRLSVIGAFA